MIEVNLLPGAKKGKRGSSAPSINFAAIGAAISARVKDKWLAAAVVTGAVVLVAIGYLFLGQQTRESSIKSSEAKAIEDSTKFATVLQDAARAQSRRDSALVQLNVIRAIDEDRYIWPHILDEISRALPQVTWLRGVAVSGTPQGANPPATRPMPAPDTAKGKAKKKHVDPEIVRDTVHFKVVGRTVDIQALTRFYRNLEDSPFLGSVQLQKSTVVVEGAKEVTEFSLDMMYTRPDSTLLKRVPLTMNPR